MEIRLIRSATLRIEVAGARLLIDPWLVGPVSGFVLRVPDEPALYWAGDTILCDEMREVIAREKPDVIVVHACGAAWGGVGPLVMDAAMVIETFALSGEALVIATRLDPVDHATVSRQELRRAAEAHPGLLHRLLIPADGEAMAFRPERSGS